MAGFMGDSSEGTFRKATGSVFPDCFIIGVSVQSSEGSQFSWKVGTAITHMDAGSVGRERAPGPLIAIININLNIKYVIR